MTVTPFPVEGGKEIWITPEEKIEGNRLPGY